RRHLHRREHLVRLEPDPVGDLRDRRGPAQLVLERLGRRIHLGEVLLQPAWNPNGPGPVAKVAPDLAGDRWGGEGAELVLQRWVEPLDRLDEPKEADLLDVLERLATVGKAPRDVVDEVAVQLDEALADPRIAGLVELAEQTPHLG